MRKIAIVMGSASDLPIAEKAADVLRQLDIPFETRVISAHRTPDTACSFAREAKGAGFGAVIAIAGKAAHLAGFIAAQTRLPVIGVPVKSPDLGGMDALLATVQMPPGVPVACVAIDGGANAAWLAARMLALGDDSLSDALERKAADMAEAVAKSDAEVSAKLRGEA